MMGISHVFCICHQSVIPYIYFSIIIGIEMINPRIGTWARFAGG